MSISEQKNNADQKPLPRGTTGPTSEQGKKISSQNAIKHGIHAWYPTQSNRAPARSHRVG